MELEQMEVMAGNLGRVIGEAVKGEDGKPKVGFCLILTDIEIGPDTGFFTYISNCQREDMIKLLFEAIGKISNKEEV